MITDQPFTYPVYRKFTSVHVLDVSQVTVFYIEPQGQTNYNYRTFLLLKILLKQERPIGQVAKVKQVYVKDSDNVVKKLDEIYVKKDNTTVEKIHQTVNKWQLTDNKA